MVFLILCIMCFCSYIVDIWKNTFGCGLMNHIYAFLLLCFMCRCYHLVDKFKHAFECKQCFSLLLQLCAFATILWRNGRTHLNRNRFFLLLCFMYLCCPPVSKLKNAFQCRLITLSLMTVTTCFCCFLEAKLKNALECKNW